MPSKVDVDQIRTGLAIGDITILEDIGGGVPGLPAVDGSQLTGITATAVNPTGMVAIKIGGCPELMFTRSGCVMFLRKGC